jgi:hypothetical protein
MSLLIVKEFSYRQIIFEAQVFRLKLSTYNFFTWLSEQPRLNLKFLDMVLSTGSWLLTCLGVNMTSASKKFLIRMWYRFWLNVFMIIDLTAL